MIETNILNSEPGIEKNNYNKVDQDALSQFIKSDWNNEFAADNLVVEAMWKFCLQYGGVSESFTHKMAACMGDLLTRWRQ